LHRMREDPGRDNNIDEELLNFQNRESCWTWLLARIEVWLK
jgi:hypothetical protein